MIMIPRRDFAAAGLSAAALAALQVAGMAQERGRKPGIGSPNPTDLFEPCARACSDCQRECDYCATHCADMLGKGEQTHLVTLQSCLDCADVCASAAHIVSRHGVLSETICQACAVACSRCGQECEKFAKDDERMRTCAEQCRACEKACRDMVAHASRSAKG